jgi:hypothetical protein
MDSLGVLADLNHAVGMKAGARTVTLSFPHLTSVTNELGVITTPALALDGRGFLLAKVKIPAIRAPRIAATIVATAPALAPRL